MAEKGSFEIKVGLAEMLKGGVIMDVMNADQAKIAEDAGAVAVMAFESMAGISTTGSTIIQDLNDAQKLFLYGEQHFNGSGE